MKELDGMTHVMSQILNFGSHNPMRSSTLLTYTPGEPRSRQVNVGRRETTSDFRVDYNEKQVISVREKPK